MDTNAIRDLADELYEIAEHAGGGQHNLKAAIATGSFDIGNFLDILAEALPIIIDLIKALIGQPAVIPKT